MATWWNQCWKVSVGEKGRQNWDSTIWKYTIKSTEKVYLKWYLNSKVIFIRVNIQLSIVYVLLASKNYHFVCVCVRVRTLNATCCCYNVYVFYHSIHIQFLLRERGKQIHHCAFERIINNVTNCVRVNNKMKSGWIKTE